MLMELRIDEQTYPAGYTSIWDAVFGAQLVIFCWLLWSRPGTTCKVAILISMLSLHHGNFCPLPRPDSPPDPSSFWTKQTLGSLGYEACVRDSATELVLLQNVDKAISLSFSLINSEGYLACTLETMEIDVDKVGCGSHALERWLVRSLEPLRH